MQPNETAARTGVACMELLAMFSIRQKREIADAVHRILRETDHPELPPHPQEIQFLLHVQGAEPWSWADIRNNGAVPNPSMNLHNEMQDPKTAANG